MTFLPSDLFANNPNICVLSHVELLVSFCGGAQDI
jgi:hypothetical protein